MKDSKSNGKDIFDEPILLVTNVRSLKEEKTKGKKQPLREAKNAASGLMVENAMSKLDDSDSDTGEESNPAEEGNKTKTKNEPIRIGAQKFGCPFCSQTMSTPSYMKRHILTHTGQQPFSCNYCGKSFNQKNNLIRHTMIHTGERPFSCGYCGKSFIQKFEVQSHMRNNH